jgi:hypothetical protein
MTHGRYVTLGLFCALLTLPSLSHAEPDAETKRLENAVFCQANPIRCVNGVYYEQDTEAIQRRTTTIRQKVAAETARDHAAADATRQATTPMMPTSTPSTPETSAAISAASMTPRQQAIAFECARAVLAGQTTIQQHHFTEIDTCRILVDHVLPR